MTPFHHCNNPLHKKNKSYKINDYIPPQRHDFLKKIYKFSEKYKSYNIINYISTLRQGILR